MNKIALFLLLIVYSAQHLVASAKDHSTATGQGSTSLKSLKSAVRENFIKDNGRITVAMLYQPNCSWCKKLGVTMANLLKTCDKQVNLSLIGNKGNRRQLKRELKHFSQQLAAYQASKAFLRDIGGVAASPTTLFYDQDGKLLAKRRGYIEPQQFSAAIAQLTNSSCKM